MDNANEIIEIRDICPDDNKRILEIYNYYIENTAVTFEITVPSEKEFFERTSGISAKYPYLVMLKNGNLIGYAYANYLKPREAFKYSVEISIYFDKSCRGKGYGEVLYKELEKRLKFVGITNVYACITHASAPDEYVNDSSIRFHERMGFENVGKFSNCGNKFGRWYDVVWLEKIIKE